MKHKGFTLLELLITVCIVAILSALATVSVHRARTYAKETICTDNLHEIAVSLLLRADDFGTLPTKLVQANDHFPDPAELAARRRTQPLILTFADNVAGLGATTAEAATMLGRYYGSELLRCPEVQGYVDDPEDPIYSYGINDLIRGLRLTELAFPSDTVLVADCLYDTIETGDDLGFRHRHRALAAFADGHVERFRYFEFPEALLNPHTGDSDEEDRDSHGVVVCTAEFSEDNLEVTCTSTVELSNVVLAFSDGVHQKFDELDAYEGTFSGRGAKRGEQIIGCWIKSGENDSGDGPGYGEYFPNPGYPDGE